MVDVKTGEVVNSYKIEGRKLGNSRDVVQVAQEIAAELSKGTLAEQAEEARLKEEAEKARLRAIEEARLKAETEERARIEAEEREQQRKVEEKKAELREFLRKGYVIITKDNKKYMICLNLLTNLKGRDVKAAVKAKA